jgi:hypothetical protein
VNNITPGQESASIGISSQPRSIGERGKLIGLGIGTATLVYFTRHHFTPLLLSRWGLGSGAFNMSNVTLLRSALIAHVTNCSVRSWFSASSRSALAL